MTTSCEPDLHVEFVRMKRVLLADILYDQELILTKFHAQYKLPSREYRRMAENKENMLEFLLDLLQKKGEHACKVFISLLREDLEIKETFPRLEDLDFSKLDSTSPPPLGPQPPNSTQRVGPSRGLRARRPHLTNRNYSTRKSKGPTSLQGYIQNVSELIQQKALFFRTQIKTTDKAWSVVVFKTEQRQEFIKMEEKKSLVLLEGLQNGWNKTLLFHNLSRIKVLDDPLFPVDPQIGASLVTSDQLLSNKENCGQGKSTNETSTTSEVQRTPSPPCNPQPPLETVTMKITGVRLKDEFRCPRHHLLDNLPPSQYVDCRLCDMKYGKADLKRVLSGKVLVRESEHVLELTDDHVRSLLKEQMDRGCDTIDKLEVALKEVPLTVTLNDNSPHIVC
ncbi:unnamed protein product [Lota lota]